MSRACRSGLPVRLPRVNTEEGWGEGVERSSVQTPASPFLFLLDFGFQHVCIAAQPKNDSSISHVIRICGHDRSKKRAQCGLFRVQKSYQRLVFLGAPTNERDKRRPASNGCIPSPHAVMTCESSLAVRYIYSAQPEIGRGLGRKPRLKVESTFPCIIQEGANMARWGTAARDTIIITVVRSGRMQCKSTEVQIDGGHLHSQFHWKDAFVRGLDKCITDLRWVHWQQNPFPG
ncbi:hypothetical protein DFH07DRAFT_778703 [Mycena maculata]|uniref:Uncharacterized protein n=1 Tax=Mycena maculata TaxID=230809 RepID=A0AAD7IBJ9_9AGAR|nr:hypothetical protein DFH07DRAFT_778703 [Mycena maculata]